MTPPTPFDSPSAAPLPGTLLEWLIRQYPTAKRLTFKKMLEDGRIFINGRRAARLKDTVNDTDKIEVRDRPPARPMPISPDLHIIFEDEDVLVVNKPAGLLTSTVPREKRPTLLALVREHVRRTHPQARIGLIHRLDREASGLLVFSKTHEAYEALKTELFHRRMKRVYLAMVHGVLNPPAGRIESHVVERIDGTVHSTTQHGKGELAQTDYTTIKTDGKRALLRVTLQTGRKHQIRVHLAERGHPIIGDTVYGPAGFDPPLLLSAIELGFTHPRSGQPMQFAVDAPFGL